MADQGLWFKLWCSADDDPDLDNLDIGDFGRFCKLGLLVKSHGTQGSLSLRPPSRALCAKFQVADFDALHAVFQRLPHVDVRRDNEAVARETVLTVTFRNWMKYQGDLSTSRVRRFRDRKRSRGEEKRREENETRRDEKVGRPPRAGIEILSVDQIVAEYGSRPAYAQLDVRQCAIRLDDWCQRKGKRMTRSRIEPWLNGDAKELEARRAHPNRPAPATSRATINEAWKGKTTGEVTL